MGIGFNVTCDTCGSMIVKTNNLERDSFEEITKELGKVTDGFFGDDIGQVQIESAQEMLLVSGCQFNCSEHCQNEDSLSKLKKVLNQIFRR